MPTVNFYQVNGTTPGEVDAVLPALLTKALDAGLNVVIHCPSLDRRDRLNSWLWTFSQNVFLPHGVAEDGQVEHQPIFLTADDSVPNEAQVCVILGGAMGEEVSTTDLSRYQKVLDVFDSSEGQTQNARKRWKFLKEQEAELTYFAQTAQGWQKRG